MADAISNPWQNFFDNFTNPSPATPPTNTNTNTTSDTVSNSDAPDDTKQNLDEANKELLAYLEAEKTVVTKSITTFAPIFKSFIDKSLEMEG